MVKRPKLAGYIRVSSVGGRDDEDRFRSPDWQRKAILRSADSEGFDVELFDPELDVSGSKARRPILDAIVARIQAGTLDGLIVAKLDRLSRLPPRERVQLFEDIEDAGGIVRSASEQLDESTPEGRFARDVFLGVARMQWEIHAKSFEDSKRGAVENGIPPFPHLTPGLRKREDRRLEHDPDVAPVIRELFERRAQGAGPVELARLLHEHGVPSQRHGVELGQHAVEAVRHGNRADDSREDHLLKTSGWTSRGIYALLKNPIYKGVLSYGGRFINENAVEPIVDLATWEAAQRPKRTLPAVRAESTWLLSGIIRCESCRHCMQGTPDGRGTRVYRCPKRHGDGVCPAPARVIADEAEHEVAAAFWALTENIAVHGTEAAGDDLEALQAALETAQERRRRYLAPEVQDALDPATWAAGLRERQDAVTNAATALGHVRTSGAMAPEVVDVQTLRNAWDRATIVERRGLLALRLDAVAARGSRQGERHLTVWPAGTLAGEQWPLVGRRKNGVPTPALRPFPSTQVRSPS